MIKGGALGEAEAIFGMHVDYTIPTGTVASIAGPLLAAVSMFEAKIVGIGGHAAEPHNTADPVLAASFAILALQQLISRETDPLHSQVLSVTYVRGGTASNVIPSYVVFGGTLRSLTTEGLYLLRRRLEEEEKEQCSPVSVLDPPFQDDDEGRDGDGEGDDDEDGCDLECSYANVQRTKHHLLQKLRRFEQLAGLDPIELEKRMLEEDDDDDECEEDETDMKKLEEAVRSVEMEGLFWGASKLVSVGYEIKKLQIMLTIVGDLVSVDDLIEEQLTVEPPHRNQHRLRQHPDRTPPPPFPPAPWSLLPLHLLTPPTLPLPQSASGPSRFWLMMS
ncbi:hypothetical protein TB1_029589 [Malus domestica]